jgi:hypothetical protein
MNEPVPAQESQQIVDPELLAQLRSLRCPVLTQRPLGDWVQCILLSISHEGLSHQWTNGKTTVTW